MPPSSLFIPVLSSSSSFWCTLSFLVLGCSSFTSFFSHSQTLIFLFHSCTLIFLSGLPPLIFVRSSSPSHRCTLSLIFIIIPFNFWKLIFSSHPRILVFSLPPSSYFTRLSFLSHSNIPVFLSHSRSHPSFSSSHSHFCMLVFPSSVLSLIFSLIFSSSLLYTRAFIMHPSFRTVMF